VDLPSAERYAADDVGTFVDAFHGEHEARFTYKMLDNPVEFLHWRLSAIGISPSIAQDETPASDDPAGAAEAALSGHRDAYFPQLGESVSTPVYSAGKLVPGARIKGHAIVEATNTTVVVDPGDELTVLNGGRLLIEGAEGQSVQ
jgi:N-methylhydantoinase A/oxoprolinase/acetone carboxylase beta subunit